MARVWSSFGPEIESGTGAEKELPKGAPKAPEGVAKYSQNATPNGTFDRPSCMDFRAQKRVRKEASKTIPDLNPELDPKVAVARERKPFGREIELGRDPQKGTKIAPKMCPKGYPKSTQNLLQMEILGGQGRSIQNPFKPAPVE